MTVRERTALTLLALGWGSSVLAAYGFAGWPAAAAVAGVLLLALGLLLAYGDSEAPHQRTYLDVLHEWAIDEDVKVLDFDQLPVPERLAALLDTLRAA